MFSSQLSVEFCRVAEAPTVRAPWIDIELELESDKEPEMATLLAAETTELAIAWKSPKTDTAALIVSCAEEDMDKFP